MIEEPRSFVRIILTSYSIYVRSSNPKVEGGWLPSHGNPKWETANRKLAQDVINALNVIANDGVTFVLVETREYV